MHARERIEGRADSCAVGKVIREGMGQATGLPDSETLDLIITNALIIDWSGIYKVCLMRMGPQIKS